MHDSVHKFRPSRALASVLCSLLLVSCGGGGMSASAPSGPPSSGNPPPGDPNAPDYSSMANWVCRPGRETVCTTGLNALVQQADGSTSTQTFSAAADPVIDCFYVYPTVSKEQMPIADLTDSPEIQDITKIQVGRMSSRCRVFAPIYRQVTLFGLNQGGGNSGEGQQDVYSAWQYYMQHDNQGRGVVLIGHSQGTILLQGLIASQIDGRSSQAQFVSAFLPGNPSLGVPPGQKVGGTFQQIPLCSSAGQVGCVYVWASYLSGDASSPMFGRARGDGLVSACVNPAAPAGGVGNLKFYYQHSSPPFLEALGQFTGECQSQSDGSAEFVVTVKSGQFQTTDIGILHNSEIAAGWGLHTRDIDLVEGNMLDVLDAEIATWQSTH